MTRVGVLSDTHLHRLADAATLVDLLLAGPFAGVNRILHAGDMVIPELLDLFAPMGTAGVRGNCDPGDAGLPTKRIVRIEQCRIGLIHGWGEVQGLEERVLAEFSDQSLDALVYGHSHQPVCHNRQGVLCFNPGSALDRRRAPQHTVGLLEVEGDKVRGEVIALPW